MSRISTDGKPLPLTLVPQQAYAAIADAAHSGYVADANGHKLSAAKYLESLVAAPDAITKTELAGAYAVGAGGTLAAGAALLLLPGGFMLVPGAMLANVATRGTAPLLFAGKMGITIIIANGLEGPLRQTDYWLVRGRQTGYPALVDPKDLQPPHNAGVIDGHTTLQLGDDPLELYGVGCYRFEKDRSFGGLGVFGTSGVLTFTADDPASECKTLGVSWHIPEKLEAGKPSFGLTADLSGNYKSLEAFYEATAGSSGAGNHEVSAAGWRVQGSLVPRDSDPHAGAGALINTKTDAGEYVLTLSVQQA